ncbi:hypothetical protein Syun_003583 [Stephania yunnanensis]|uniref:Uncharacterized protein n=1 Tax=Stephania yunnanensis TaxID=152371 RepID=A0AAP0L1J8_9MAGN
MEIHEETFEQEDEEEDQGRSNRVMSIRTPQTYIVGESNIRSRPPYPSGRTETTLRVAHILSSTTSIYPR